ncbi:MAG: hypothetical protein AAFW00_12660 [Bacteroidota bacterium]
MQQLTKTETHQTFLHHRIAFVLEALEEEHAALCEEMLGTQDAYKQEYLWSQWIEYFFTGGLITWQGFASVPIMLELLQKKDWFDRRMILEYLAFWVEKVDAIYFFYDSLREVSYKAEEERWHEVRSREICRPWLQLAFHTLRTHISVIETIFQQGRTGEQDLCMRILWYSLRMGKLDVQPETQIQLTAWAKQTARVDPYIDENQLNLFGL